MFNGSGTESQDRRSNLLYLGEYPVPKTKRAVKRAAKRTHKRSTGRKVPVETAIERAIRLIGGTETALAEATGFPQGTISKAKRGRCSLHLALAIHHATRVPLSQIRPDIWGPRNQFRPRVAA